MYHHFHRHPEPIWSSTEPEVHVFVMFSKGQSWVETIGQDQYIVHYYLWKTVALIARQMNVFISYIAKNHYTGWTFRALVQSSEYYLLNWHVVKKKYCMKMMYICLQCTDVRTHWYMGIWLFILQKYHKICLVLVKWYDWFLLRNALIWQALLYIFCIIVRNIRRFLCLFKKFLCQVKIQK